jgi:hypothetical protein
VPAERFEAGSDVFAEGDVGAGGQGDVILVVEVDELAKLEIASDGRGLEGDPFHDVTIGDDAIGVVIYDSWPGRLKVSARKRSAMAKPTPLAKPWPSGPVVTSTPGVKPRSG